MINFKKEINKKIEAINKLSGMFEVNDATRKKSEKGYRFVLKTFCWKLKPWIKKNTKGAKIEGKF